MQQSDSYAIKDLAKHINATIRGDDTARIMRIAPITRAVSGDLTYLSGRAYQKFLPNTKATAVILSEDAAKDCLVTALVVKNPELAYARIAHFFSRSKNPDAGVHATAVIANTAVIDPSASIGAYCVIGDHVTIGAHTIILSGVIIEDSVTIGKDCFIHHHVTLHHHITIGDRVTLHSGVVIGADGFGLAQEEGRFEKIPQLGSVRIADDVDIGANTCVDRGALDDTVIERGVKIDNLVMIAHNVIIGAYTVIAGSASIAGSTRVGRHCIVGGSVNMAGHLTICDGAIFSGCAMVTGSVKEPGVYSSGTGLMPNAEWRKNVVRFKQLNEWVAKLKLLLRPGDTT